MFITKNQKVKKLITKNQKVKKFISKNQKAKKFMTKSLKWNLFGNKALRGRRLFLTNSAGLPNLVRLSLLARESVIKSSWYKNNTKI